MSGAELRLELVIRAIGTVLLAEVIPPSGYKYMINVFGKKYNHLSRKSEVLQEISQSIMKIYIKLKRHMNYLNS